MTRDFGPSLDRELDTASPPTAITADVIIHKGRRQTASRKVYTGAAALVALVLAAGMVFQIGRTATGGDVADPNPSASTGPLQPSFPLPEVDPEASWRWTTDGGPGTETETTKALTDAWWAALSGVDGGVPAVIDEDTAEPSAATKEQFDPVTRIVEALVEDVPGAGADESDGEGVPQGYTRPVYRLDAAMLFDGLPRPDSLNVDYFPKGSYVEGAETAPGEDVTAEWRHLHAGCEDTGNAAGWRFDYTCVDTAGPNGERVTEIALTVRHPAGDGWPPSRWSIALVYFADGNAVRVVDEAPQGMAPEDTTPSIEDPQPGLTPHQLAEMVFAMPPVVIT